MECAKVEITVMECRKVEIRGGERIHHGISSSIFSSIEPHYVFIPSMYQMGNLVKGLSA